MTGSKFYLFLLFSLFIGAAGCESKPGGNSSPANQAAAPQAAATPQKTADTKGGVGACSVLTQEEFTAVQGEAFKETKTSDHTDASFIVSRCFYVAPTFAKSVSLDIVSNNPANSNKSAVREFWNERVIRTTGGEEEGEKESERDRERERERERGRGKEGPKERGGDRESEEEREKEMSKPLKVTGVGDDAYWVGNVKVGALYVLKGNTYLRISIGGAEDVPSKINKLKALAQHALKHLS
ncbi:MAG TPA: hypothetical protein VF723_10140 [Pyrinomonadaceae bacterium]|jgi:hypothetical protein